MQAAAPDSIQRTGSLPTIPNIFKAMNTGNVDPDHFAHIEILHLPTGKHCTPPITLVIAGRAESYGRLNAGWIIYWDDAIRDPAHRQNRNLW
ncbi:MAG: hypothetical protein ABI947_26620 [Chloroflexota bacterium]